MLLGKDGIVSLQRVPGRIWRERSKVIKDEMKEGKKKKERRERKKGGSEKKRGEKKVCGCVWCVQFFPSHVLVKEFGIDLRGDIQQGITHAKEDTFVHFCKIIMRRNMGVRAGKKRRGMQKARRKSTHLAEQPFILKNEL